MRVAFATPEVYPFSKTGGLADVSGALPFVLAACGVQVSVFTPLYRSSASWLQAHQAQLEQLKLPHELWIGDEQHYPVYKKLTSNGVQFIFIDDPQLFDRNSLYQSETGTDYPDNLARYTCFSRAVLEYYSHLVPPPDLFHAHDWQAALVPVYLKTSFSRPSFSHVRSLLTVHNLGYQGLFPAEQIYSTGFGWELFTPERLEYFGQLNLLKAGLIYADAVNTVSPTYAREIQDAEQGLGLHGVMSSIRGKLTGILNGIDAVQWDPATDPHLPAHYSADDLSGKSICKKRLQLELGLPIRPRSMVLGMVTRLDRQKGIELLLEAFPSIAALDIQLIILGSGDLALQERLSALVADFPEQVALRLGYDEPLAHLIHAGADVLLMPSLYEPCGLNQMYGQRYGTLPIVRETGGLKDSVVNCTPKRIAEGRASGFTFRQFDARRLAEAVKRAAEVYFTERRTWTKLLRSVMSIDNSWQARAQSYLALYERILSTVQKQAEAGTHE